MIKIDRRQALAVVAVLGFLKPRRGSAELKFTRFERPKPLPAFALQDQDGHPFGLAQLKGHWTLLFMGYTFCPDICPYTLANLEAVRGAMAKRMRPERVPGVVFLAVDPARDKPVLKAYLSNFGGGFAGITGSIDAIQILVDGIGGYVRREPTDKDGNYTVVHSATVNLVDPSARIVASLLPPFEPEETASRLITVIEQAPLG